MHGSCSNDVNNNYSNKTVQDTSLHTQPQMHSTALVNTMRGKDLFMNRCNDCHGPTGSAREMNAANLQVSVLDSIGMAQTIRNGRGIMPAFKDVLPDSDVAQVILYVRSMRQ